MAAVISAWRVAMLDAIATKTGVLITVPYVTFVHGNRLGQVVAERRAR